MNDKDVTVTDLQGVTPHNAALYEAGKALLVASVDVGREFCKTMITVAMGAVATYLALLGLAVGKDYRPSVAVGGLLLVPVVALLVSACLFAWGYFPKTTDISLDSVESISTTRSEIVSRRRTLAAAGFGLFVLAVVAAVAGTVYGFTLETATPAAPK
jgi:hypothetical protein